MYIYIYKNKWIDIMFCCFLFCFPEQYLLMLDLKTSPERPLVNKWQKVISNLCIWRTLNAANVKLGSARLKNSISNGFRLAYSWVRTANQIHGGILTLSHSTETNKATVASGTFGGASEEDIRAVHDENETDVSVSYEDEYRLCLPIIMKQTLL